MKKLLLLVACVFVSILEFHAQTENFYYFQVKNKSITGNGMSPNGKYIVGADQTPILYGNSSATGLASFIWKLEDDTKEWLTVADINKLENSGCFNDVNDEGVIVGYYKDPKNKITTIQEGIEATLPINTAAIWINGQVTSLGLGDDLKLENCKRFEDGTNAIAISNDGKIIVGEYRIQNTYFPCLWKKNTDGMWQYQSLELPSDKDVEVINGLARDISADGSIIVGEIQIKNYAIVPVFWKDGKINRINTSIEDTLLVQPGSQSYAASVSQNGEYISVVFDRKTLALYSVSKNEYVKIEQAGANSVMSAPIANNGDVMPTFSFGSLLGKGIYYRPMWYSYTDRKIMDFNYFMTIFAPEVKPPFSFNIEDYPQAFTAAMSVDGSVIMGVHSTPHPVIPTRKIASCWVLKARTDNVDIPQIPVNLKGQLTGFRKVTLTWPNRKNNESVYSLKSYKVYGDGQLISNVLFDASKESYEYIVENAQEGYIQYAISGVYSSENIEELESPKSDFAVVAVPGTFELPLFEGLETKNWESNFWTFTKEIENDDLYNYWGSLKYLGFQGYAGCATANTKSPYSLSTVSRPMDATNVTGKIHVAFAMKYNIYQGTSKDLSKDSVSLDISTDWGSNWKEIAAWTPEQLSGFYNFESVEITKEVVGKLFKIRFRAHGRGEAQLKFFIDQISVQEEYNDIPTGLIAYDVKDQGRKLMWKNSNGAYELNYMGNPYGNALGKTIGNEGKEIIGANLYDTALLAPFEGKYLTAVTTAFNWYKVEGETANSQMNAEIMVWEDNTLIRQQKIDSVEFNKEFIVLLKEPVRIDASKSLKIGIKISDYDAQQLPLLYINSMSYVTGKSDLYSEDGGKTWHTLLDAFADSENPDDGLAAWRISGNITDEPVIDDEVIFNDTLVAYNVYCNGRKINRHMIYSLQARFLEENPPTEGSYEVRAFYINGGVSPLSEALDYKSTGIFDNQSKQLVVYVDRESKMIHINGDFNKAALYSMDGQMLITTTNAMISVSGIPKGNYLLKVELENGVEIHKILKR